MDRFVLILLAIALAFAVISYLLNRVFRGRRFVKYILPIFILGTSAYYFYSATIVKGGTGFEDLGNILLAIMLLAGGLAGTITSLILDRRRKRKY